MIGWLLRRFGQALLGHDDRWDVISDDPLPDWSIERRHADDAWGLVVQRTIARYYLTRATRAELAVEIHVSERIVQSYIRAETWGAYGRPVLRALERLGIGRRRGDWWDPEGRGGEIIRAQRAVMRRAIDCLEGAPPTPDRVEAVVADLHLLTVAPGDES